MINVEIDEKLKQYFQDLLNKSGIIVEFETLEKMMTYLELLHEKNKVVNLTAIRDKKEMIEKDFIDSLFLSKIIKNEEKTFKRTFKYSNGCSIISWL